MLVLNDIHPFSYYLIPLILTVAVELAVAMAFGYRKKQEIGTVTLVNLITNPLLNFILLTMLYLGFDAFGGSVFLEIVVVLLEWGLLKFALRKNIRKPFLLSLVMNLCSYTAGMLIFQ